MAAKSISYVTPIDRKFENNKTVRRKLALIRGAFTQYADSDYRASLCTYVAKILDDTIPVK